MPLDWENNVVVKNHGQKTRFCSVNIDEPESCYKVSAHIQLTLLSISESTTKVEKPSWSASPSDQAARPGSLCKYNRYPNPCIFSPEGVIAVLLKNSAFLRYGEAGCLTCLPWTEAKYLVSKQDFVYESPGNRVLTRDNLNIDISLSILIKINPEHEYVQQLVTNVP